LGALLTRMSHVMNELDKAKTTGVYTTITTDSSYSCFKQLCHSHTNSYLYSNGSVMAVKCERQHIEVRTS